MNWSFVAGFTCGTFACIAIHWGFKRLEMWALIRTARTSRLENASKASINNRAAVEAATVACCYFCFTTSRPSQIHAWTDEGKTVLCPHCDIDAVLPGYHSLTELQALHERWFAGRPK